MNRIRNASSNILSKRGFAPVVREGNESFHLVGGSMQYFGGDVNRIKKYLKDNNIHYRIIMANDDTGLGAWLIYVSNKHVGHLNNYRDSFNK